MSPDREPQTRPDRGPRPTSEQKPRRELPGGGAAVVPSELPEAMDAAMRYLAPRARSSREVRDHLSRKGFGAEVAAAAEARLVELGILDDAELARSSMDRAVVGRHEAPARIRETLAGKGVAPDAIDAALAEIAPGNDVESALAAAASRLRLLHGPQPAVRRRLGAFLARRGYDAEVVEEVCDRLLGVAESGDGHREEAPGEASVR